jgi:hypothetical protein
VPRTGKKTKLRELITEREWRRIGDSEWDAIARAIPGILPEDLQILEIPVDPPWCGVRWHSLRELEESLNALSGIYCARPDLRRFCRNTVIRTKERTRWATRNPRVDEEKRRLKAEMLEWTLVWLGDPALFPAWAKIRREKLNSTPAAQTTAQSG